MMDSAEAKAIYDCLNVTWFREIWFSEYWESQKKGQVGRSWLLILKFWFLVVLYFYCLSGRNIKSQKDWKRKRTETLLWTNTFSWNVIIFTIAVRLRWCYSCSGSYGVLVHVIGCENTLDFSIALFNLNTTNFQVE